MAYEAYLNFSQPYLSPTVVVKGPDGTVFSRGNDDPFYFSATTAYWVDRHRKGLNEGLVYRPDADLVSMWENPDLYDKLIREAGELVEEGKTVHNTNVLGILIYLQKYPRYSSRDCGVPLFAFEEYYPPI